MVLLIFLDSPNLLKLVRIRSDSMACFLTAGNLSFNIQVLQMLATISCNFRNFDNVYGTMLL